MKKILAYIFVLGSFTFMSCEGLLKEDPKSFLVSNNFYKNAEDANSAINAVSATLHADALYRFRYLVHTTAFEDYASGQGVYIPLSQYQITSSVLGITDGIWTGFYKTVDAANLAIKYVPAINMDNGRKEELLGEAYFYRALAYHNLARNFGAVPIRTEPTESVANLGGKRETLDKVYELVISDLKRAEASLPVTQSQVGRPTRGTAKTMLADIYLVRERWAEARDKAEEVISSGSYSLVSVSQTADFDKIFGVGVISSSEEIFSIKFQHSTGGGTFLPQFYHLVTSAWATTGFGTFFGFQTYPLLRDWPQNDLRKAYNIYSAGPNKQGQIVQNSATQPIRFGKFKDSGAPASASHAVDFPIYRFAEVLLIYAEAASQAQNGPNALAVERLNMVRRRAYGFNPGVSSSADVSLAGLDARSFRDLVIKERAYEFMVEGKRWYDLIRTGTAKQVIKEAKGIDISENVFLLPIPKQEIDNNPDISPDDQNPGY